MRHEDVGRRRQGTPGSGGVRGNALWGGKREKLPMLLAVLIVLAALLGAGRVGTAEAGKGTAYVPQVAPRGSHEQPQCALRRHRPGHEGGRAATSRTTSEIARKDFPGKGFGVRRRFASIAGTSAQLTGRSDPAARRRGAASLDHARREDRSAEAYGNSQAWPASQPARATLGRTPAENTTYPTIAIVDSGVQRARRVRHRGSSRR